MQRNTFLDPENSGFFRILQSLGSLTPRCSCCWVVTLIVQTNSSPVSLESSAQWVYAEVTAEVTVKLTFVLPSVIYDL